MKAIHKKCVCVCVCVLERDGERKREREKRRDKKKSLVFKVGFVCNRSSFNILDLPGIKPWTAVSEG